MLIKLSRKEDRIRQRRSGRHAGKLSRIDGRRVVNAPLVRQSGFQRDGEPGVERVGCIEGGVQGAIAFLLMQSRMLNTGTVVSES